MKTLTGHSQGVRTFVVLPDGLLVSSSDDHTIRIWDYFKGFTIKTLTGHTGWVLSLVLIPDGSLASGS